MTSLAENDSSDVSSFSTDDNDDAASSYTSRSTAPCDSDPNYALSLGMGSRGWDFSKVDKLTFENCIEGHVGTKIVTENVNIIVGKEKSSEIRTIFDDQLKLQCTNTAKLSKDSQDIPAKSLNYWAVGGCSLLILGVLVSLTTFAFEEEPQDRSTEFPTKDPEPVTMSDEYPTMFFSSTIGPESDVNVVSRLQWGGMTPSNTYYITGNNFEYITLDNLSGKHCSTLRDCSAILKQAEKGSGESLNYNFLMDDSGTVYEARGWNYQCVEQGGSCSFNNTLKLGFIGSYNDVPLTKFQKSVLPKFLRNPSHIVQVVIEIKSLCCCGIPNVNVPETNIICDAKSAVPLSLGFVENECTKCPTTC